MGKEERKCKPKSYLFKSILNFQKEMDEVVEHPESENDNAIDHLKVASIFGIIKPYFYFQILASILNGIHILDL